VKPGGKIMGLSLSHGGHLTHGHFTPKRAISSSSHYFQSQPYFVNPESGEIDYDQLLIDAKKFKPDIIIAGASAYPLDYDYKRFREIADEVGAIFMADIAHISGLVASGFLNDPFLYCDIVTTTTHKSLRGPRAGMIFSKDKETAEKIDFAVFPMS